MSRSLPTAVLLGLLATLAAAGCEGARSSASQATATRDTLPDGVVRVRYEALPAAVLPVEVDLRIGAVEGDPHLIFGDVRGIEADAEGTIYVLDYQASEVRAFDGAGNFLRVVASEGQGPGEIMEANGIVFDDDGTLWIQDHGQWTMVGVSPEGEEVARFPMYVLSYGFIWNGMVDNRGRFWKAATHSDEERVFPPPEGLSEGTFRTYLKWHDPGTESTDSVYVGDGSYRSHVSRNSRGGYSYRQIPFTPAALTIVDPAGGFWQASTEAYRIARLDERGDTVLFVEAPVEPEPVTAADRSSYVERVSDDRPEARRAAEDVADLMPATKPVLASLSVDDEGRLWVERVTPEDEPPLYDVFTRDGEYVRSFRLDFDPEPYFPPRVRNERLYALVTDSLDVPYVVRAPLPEIGR